MRAKRSKKYRKIMHTYQMHFSFREPYQVLVTSSFLRATHAFQMPIQKFLDNTLHGKTMPYITQCTLAKVMDGYSGRGKGGRPDYLPPPTEVPLRYCKHKDNEGNEKGVVTEEQCLTDLISGHARGNETRKNKEHFTLATADWDEGIKDEAAKEKLQKERNRKRKLGELEADVRDHARTIPGVPIVYVKRSVMILEEPSVASERAVRGTEKDKFRDGIGGTARGIKRKQEDDEEDASEEHQSGQAIHQRKRKVKEPNPLSVRKKKPKPAEGIAQTDDKRISADTRSKPTRRKRGKSGKADGGRDFVLGQALAAGA